jgi:hypothetical protein
MAVHSDLADLIVSLQTTVARPGTFEDLFPESTDDLLLSVLCDGLAEAHLEGLLMAYECDEDGIVDPPLTSGRSAVVVLFAAVRFLRSDLLNRNTSVVYEAGSAHYETTQATNILRDILKALQDQKDRVVAKFSDTGGSVGANAAFLMADQYLARIWDEGPLCAVGW